MKDRHDKTRQRRAREALNFAGASLFPIQTGAKPFQEASAGCNAPPSRRRLFCFQAARVARKKAIHDISITTPKPAAATTSSLGVTKLCTQAMGAMRGASAPAKTK